VVALASEISVVGSLERLGLGLEGDVVAGGAAVASKVVGAWTPLLVSRRGWSCAGGCRKTDPSPFSGIILSFALASPLTTLNLFATGGKITQRKPTDLPS
jgi:hypothetical protein